MSGRISIYAPQITVPVADAPRSSGVDVSSGLTALAESRARIEQAQRVTMVNDAQIGSAKAFDGLNETLRRTPWQDKRRVFQEGLAKIRNEYFDSIPDGQARSLFKPDFERMAGINQAEVNNDAFKGEQSHNIAQANDAVDVFARQAAFARSPQEREAAIEGGAGVISNLVVGGYIDEDQRQRWTSQFLGRSDFVSAKQLVDVNPTKALATLSKAGAFPHLDPSQVEQLKDQAKTEIRRLESEARAQAALARSEALFDITNWSQADAQSRAETGRPVDAPYTDDELKKLLKPKQYETLKHNQQRADLLFQSTGAMRTQTPAEMLATVENLKPQGGEADFNDRNAVYKSAQQIMQSTLAARRADPGLAARIAYPATVGAAWQAFEKNNTPETLQAAVKATLAAQTAMGVPAAQQWVMEHDRARAIAGQINGAKPEQAAKELKSIGAQFGAFWPQAYGQMSKLLDGHMRVAATIDDAGQAAVLIEASRQPLEALRKTVSPPTGDEAIPRVAALDSRVQAMVRSVAMSGGGGAKLSDQIVPSIELLAMERMRRFGESADKATEVAITTIIDQKYDFGEINSTPFRVPRRGNDVPLVERGAATAQSNIKAEDFEALDLPGQVQGTVGVENAEDYASAVRRNGYWVTSKDEAGAYLFSERNVPVTIKGKPVFRTWAELQGTAPPDSSYTLRFGDDAGPR